MYVYVCIYMCVYIYVYVYIELYSLKGYTCVIYHSISR